MSASATASRRSFLKGGAIAAAPLAVGVPAIAVADNEHKARAQRLQDEAEIRALHAAWLRKVATGEDASGLFADAKASRLDRSIQAVSADHTGHPDRIEIAADGLIASGRFAVLADLQTARGVGDRWHRFQDDIVHDRCVARCLRGRPGVAGGRAGSHPVERPAGGGSRLPQSTRRRHFQARLGGRPPP